MVGIAISTNSLQHNRVPLDFNEDTDEYGIIDRTLMRDERNRTLFHWSPLAIVIVNEQGTVLDSNKKLHEWLGYKPEHIIGKNILELPFLSDDAKKILIRKFTRRLLGEDLPVYEIPFIHKDGHTIWGEIHGSLFTDESTNITFDLVMIADITQKMKAIEKIRESEEKYRTLFEQANVLIQSINAEGQFVEVNPKWLQVLQYTREDITHLTLKDILRSDQIEHCMQLFKRIQNGEKLQNIQTVFIAKDGTEIAVEGNASALFKENRFIASIGIFREKS